MVGVLTLVRTATHELHEMSFDKNMKDEVPVAPQ